MRLVRHVTACRMAKACKTARTECQRDSEVCGVDEAIPGVRLCISCQETADKEAVTRSGYNRRGSKDSQLRLIRDRWNSLRA